MNDLLRLGGRGCSIALLLLIAAVSALAQGNSHSSEPSVFVFVQKTSGVANFGSRHLFEHVVDDFTKYLNAHQIANVMRTDDFSSRVALPLPAVEEMTRNANAPYLLYVVVDRPFMQWLKVTVACYNAAGQPIWTEEASATKELTRGTGERDALKHLHETLDHRLGQPGLLAASLAQQKTPPAGAPASSPGSEPKPMTGAPAPGSEPTPTPTPTAANPAAAADIHEESLQTIRMPSGTPVHLFLADTISSKTAKPGDTVKLQVLGDVKAGDLVVIANKAPAVGTIETVQNAKRAWRAGRLIVKLQTVTLVDQKEQRLEAWNASKGADTGAGIEWTNAVLQSYGFALLALPFAPLQHGNEAFLYKGALLDAATTGDALLPRADVEAAQPKPAEPRSGPAEVTVYYPDLGHGSSADIWCGQLRVGRLRRGGKLTLTLPPAKYWLRFGPGSRAVITELDAESGAQQYVSVVVGRVTTTQLETYWVPHLSVMPHDIGEAQSADETTGKSEHVLTADKLDLSQLQADPRKKKK
jgi:hypothetical protein